MPTIMDIIKQRKQAAGTAPASAQQLAEQQATAATGKVGRGAGGPQMSNLGAQLAAQATQAQQQQLATQGAMQTQALTAAEQQQDKQFQQAQKAQQMRKDTATKDLAAKAQMADSQEDTQHCGVTRFSGLA